MVQIIDFYGANRFRSEERENFDLDPDPGHDGPELDRSDAEGREAALRLAVNVQDGLEYVEINIIKSI
jgi:hypothetical protein